MGQKGVFVKCILLMTTFSLLAFSHFEIGVYKGSTIEGKDCTFEFISKSFKSNVKSPYNELVAVSYDGDEPIELNHPILDYEDQIMLKKDVLRGVRGLVNENGTYAAEMVKVYMSHASGHSGPSYASYSLNKISTGEVYSQKCYNLKYVQ